MDLVDIYDDLDEFHEQEEKKSKELLELEAKYNEALNTIEAMKLEKKDLRKKIRIMEQNLQSLLDTAKAEIKRKDKIIEDLRKEKDDICFRRRKVYAPPGNQNAPAASSTTNTPHNYFMHSNQQTKGLAQRESTERIENQKISQNFIQNTPNVQKVVPSERFEQKSMDSKAADTYIAKNLQIKDEIIDCVKKDPFERTKNMSHEKFGDSEKISSTNSRTYKGTDHARARYRRSKSKDRQDKDSGRYDSKERYDRKDDRDFMTGSGRRRSRSKDKSDRGAKYHGKECKGELERYSTQRYKHTAERNVSKSNRNRRSTSKDKIADDAKSDTRSSDNDKPDFKRRKIESENYKKTTSDRRDFSSERHKYTERHGRKSRSREHDKERRKYEDRHTGTHSERHNHHSSRHDNASSKRSERSERYESKNDWDNLKNQNNKKRELSTEKVRKKSFDSSESLKDDSRNRKRRRSTEGRDCDENKDRSKSRKEERNFDERLSPNTEKLRFEFENIASSEEEFDLKAESVMKTTIEKAPTKLKTVSHIDETANQISLTLETTAASDTANEKREISKQASESAPAMQLDNFKGMSSNDQTYFSNETQIETNHDETEKESIEKVNADENSNFSKTHTILDTPKKIALFDALFGASPKRTEQQTSGAGELLANVKEILDKCVVNSATTSLDAYTDVSEASTKTSDSSTTISTTTSTTTSTTASVESNKDTLLQPSNVVNSDSLAACLPIRVVNISDQICNFSPSSVISISSSVTTQLKITDSPEKMKDVIDDRSSEIEILISDIDEDTKYLNKRKSKEACLAECDESVRNFKVNEQQQACFSDEQKMNAIKADSTPNDNNIAKEQNTNEVEKIIVIDDDSITSLIDAATASIVADIKINAEAKSAAFVNVNANENNLQEIEAKKNNSTMFEGSKSEQLATAAITIENENDVAEASNKEIATDATSHAVIAKTISHTTTSTKSSIKSNIFDEISKAHFKNPKKSNKPECCETFDRTALNRKTTTSPIDYGQHIMPVVMGRTFDKELEPVQTASEGTQNKTENIALDEVALTKKPINAMLERSEIKPKEKIVFMETEAVVADELKTVNNDDDLTAVSKVEVPVSNKLKAVVAVKEVLNTDVPVFEKPEKTRFECNTASSKVKKATVTDDLTAVNNEITSLVKAAVAKTNDVITAIEEEVLAAKCANSQETSNSNNKATAEFEGKADNTQHAINSSPLDAVQAIVSNKANIRALNELTKSIAMKPDVPELDDKTSTPCPNKSTKSTTLKEDVAVSLEAINTLAQVTTTNANEAEGNLVVNEAKKSANKLLSKENKAKQTLTAVPQLQKVADETADVAKDIKFEAKIAASKKVALKNVQAVETNKKQQCKKLPNKKRKTKEMLVKAKNEKTSVSSNAAENKLQIEKMQIQKDTKFIVKDNFLQTLLYQTSSDESSSDVIPLAQLKHKEKIEIIENIRLPTLFNETKKEIQTKINFKTKKIEDIKTNTFPQSTKPMITDKIDLIKPYSSIKTPSMMAAAMSLSNNIITEENCDSGIVVETMVPEFALRLTPPPPSSSSNEVQANDAETSTNNSTNDNNLSLVTPNTTILNENNDENACTDSTAQQALQQLNDLIQNDKRKCAIKKKINKKIAPRNTKPKTSKKSYIKLDMVKSSKNKADKRSVLTNEQEIARTKPKRQLRARDSIKTQTKTETTKQLNIPQQTLSPTALPDAEQVDFETSKLNTSDDFKAMLTAETSPLSMSVSQMTFHDAKFVDIDKSMQAIFQSPIRIEAETPLINESNTTINETVDDSAQRELELAVSSILATDSSANTTIAEYKNSSFENSFESKRLSLGASEYLVERVSENVVSMFIRRKRRKKPKNLIIQTDTET